jgi:hypothetical protein
MNASTPTPSEPDEPITAPVGALRAVVERCYPLDNGLLGLITAVAAITLLTQFAVLAVFLLKRPAALQAAMWGQIFLQGFPVTLLVNLAAGAFYAEYFAPLSASRAPRILMILIGEFAVRAILFTLLTAVSLMSWALLNGAFGGDPDVALRSVGITLHYGLRFEGLAGVYLYSMVLAAFPFLSLLILRLLPGEGTGRTG